MIGNAAELMTCPVIGIKYGDTLEKAIKVLAENNISGLPVTDDDNKVIGMISEKDIVDYSVKLQVISLIASSGWVSPYTDVSEIATFERGHNLIIDTKVKDVMKKKVIAVRLETPGEEIVSLMKKKDINRIPVTDESGVLVGIVTRTNIINYLADNI